MADQNTIAGTVSWICEHQDLVVAGLAWGLGLAPVASAAAWLNAKRQKLPPWVQPILHLVGLNLVHAVMGDPKPAPSPSISPFPPVDQPNPKPAAR